MSIESAAVALNPINAIPAIVAKAGFDQAGDARKAREAAKRLADQRQAQLAREAADREAARKRAETAGQRVGLSSRTALLQAGGAGSGDTQFGAGEGTLFGN